MSSCHNALRGRDQVNAMCFAEVADNKESSTVSRPDLRYMNPAEAFKSLGKLNDHI